MMRWLAEKKYPIEAASPVELKFNEYSIQVYESKHKLYRVILLARLFVKTRKDYSAERGSFSTLKR